MNPDCTQSTQYQYALPLIDEQQRLKLYGVNVQHVVDPQTDLPVFHFTASEYPTDRPFYLFIACGNIECSDMTNVIDYGIHFGINRLRVADVFVDDQGTIIAISRVNYAKTNQTMNFIVRIARTQERQINEIKFV